jgi:nicotinamide-nucleotide amidase
MFAEIITIGDELLIGQVVDTNSAWIGQKLNKIGIEVLRIVSIRDREDEILEAIDNAMKRVNIVLVTGGLGPTKDDITKQTLCKYFHTRLVFSEEVFENREQIEISRYYEKLPKPTLIAAKEYEDGKVYYKNPAKEKNNL